MKTRTAGAVADRDRDAGLRATELTGGVQHAVLDRSPVTSIRYQGEVSGRAQHGRRLQRELEAEDWRLRAALRGERVMYESEAHGCATDNCTWSCPRGVPESVDSMRHMNRRGHIS